MKFPYCSRIAAKIYILTNLNNNFDRHARDKNYFFMHVYFIARTHLCVCVRACVRACVCVCMECTLVYVYTCMCTRMYAHLFIHLRRFPAYFATLVHHAFGVVTGT